MLRRAAQQLGGRTVVLQQLHHSRGAPAAGGMGGWATTSTSPRVVVGIAQHSHFSTSGAACSSGNATRAWRRANPSSTLPENRPTEFVALKDTWTERRRLWKVELNAMRKVWAGEHAHRLAMKAAYEAEKARIIAISVVERLRLKEIRKAATAIIHNAKVARELKMREEDAMISGQRRAQRDFVDHLRSTAREEELLNASRTWVTREDLDVQIEYALNNPVTMW